MIILINNDEAWPSRKVGLVPPGALKNAGAVAGPHHGWPLCLAVVTQEGDDAIKDQLGLALELHGEGSGACGGGEEHVFGFVSELQEGIGYKGSGECVVSVWRGDTSARAASYAA